jgi:hypothetical protein
MSYLGDFLNPVNDYMELTDKQCVAAGLFAIADAIVFGSKEIGKEGASGMGALEGLGVMVRDAGSEIGHALDEISRSMD